MSTLTALLQLKVKKSSKKPLSWLRRTTFSTRPIYHGPYGERDAFPCDFYASGGKLKIIEKYIDENIDSNLDRESEGSILPRKHLADLREEARQFIHKATHCSDNHVVLFTDERDFVDVFLSYIKALDLPRMVVQSRRPPVILVGHDLWEDLNLEIRKLGVEASEIQIRKDGQYDIKRMEALLKFFKKQERMIVGVFALGDGVTGVLNDADQMTGMLHAYGGLAIWDGSSAGAYTKIDMCPTLSYGGMSFKDALFIKSSLFLGGNEASGVFIANGNVLLNPIWERTPEGLLAFSCIEGSLDIQKKPMPEEPEWNLRNTRRKLFAGPLRAKAVFELKGYFGDAYLQKRTLEISQQFANRLFHNEAIHIIRCANSNGPSLPYLSILFFHPHTEWGIHHGFVVALLQDLFGIYALPHNMHVEHLPEMPNLEAQRSMHSLLVDFPASQFQQERIMNVGCVHFSLMFFMRDIDLDFLTSSVLFIAEHGWRLMPFYRFNVVTGKWMTPYNLANKTERLSQTMAKLRAIQSSTQSSQFRHMAYIERARKLIHSINQKIVSKTFKDGHVPQGDEGLSVEGKQSRWFMTPADALELLDDASPIRLVDVSAHSGSFQRRPWNAGQPPSPIKLAQLSYKRRFGH